MRIQEISPGEQLLGLRAEPAVPGNLQFAFHGLIWPKEADINAHELNRAAQAGGLRDDTMAWIDLVLKPEWRAPDLRRRLRAASSIVSRQDAFLARYAVDGNKIQIVVSRSFVHLVICPASESMALYAPAVIRAFLQVDPPGADPPWTGEPWSTVGIEGFTFGYHPRSSLTGWRDSLNYLSNRRGIKFSVQKIPTRGPDLEDMPKGGSIPTEESERHWFGQPR